eukprot:6492287-Amphidinium_carterae.3
METGRLVQVGRYGLVLVLSEVGVALVLQLMLVLHVEDVLLMQRPLTLVEVRVLVKYPLLALVLVEVQLVAQLVDKAKPLTETVAPCSTPLALEVWLKPVVPPLRSSVRCSFRGWSASAMFLDSNAAKSLSKLDCIRLPSDWRSPSTPVSLVSTCAIFVVPAVCKVSILATLFSRASTLAASALLVGAAAALPT